jgi:hypothetical protein
MTSNSNDTSAVIQEEVDLMNFDDDWCNPNDNNFDNDPIREVVQNVHVSMIDQLLCDFNFGRDHKNETKSENVQENKMIQNEQVTSKPLEQETPKKEMDDKMMSQNKSNDFFKVPPVSSLMNSMKETPPSYSEPTNGTRPPHVNVMNAKQTADPSHVTVNGMYPTVVLCTPNMKETQAEIISSAMEMKRQMLVGKPRKKRIYSFFELLIYQFSPITKELYPDVNGRFSHYVLDYDLLNDNTQTVNGQPRRPGVLRSTIYQQRNGWNTRDRAVTSPTRKHFESPLELSFLKECVIAQNRWTALLKERELRTSCIKEYKDCKSMKWINSHMSFTDKHSENCLVHHVINDQKNEARYYGKNTRSEEKDIY